MIGPATPLTAHYRVQVASEFDEHWASLLDGWLALPGAGITTLERQADQAALYGLLTRLRDLNLVLLAVERLDSS